MFSGGGGPDSVDRFCVSDHAPLAGWMGLPDGAWAPHASLTERSMPGLRRYRSSYPEANICHVRTCFYFSLELVRSSDVSGSFVHTRSGQRQLKGRLLDKGNSRVCVGVIKRKSEKPGSRARLLPLLLLGLGRGPGLVSSLPGGGDDESPQKSAACLPQPGSFAGYA